MNARTWQGAQIALLDVDAPKQQHRGVRPPKRTEAELARRIAERKAADVARAARSRARALERIAAGMCSKCAAKPAREKMKTCGTCEPAPAAKARVVDLSGCRLIEDHRADRVRLPALERRRHECTRWDECEEAWVAARMAAGVDLMAQARCPVACSAFQHRGRLVP